MIRLKYFCFLALFTGYSLLASGCVNGENGRFAGQENITPTAIVLEENNAAPTPVPTNILTEENEPLPGLVLNGQAPESTIPVDLAKLETFPETLTIEILEIENDTSTPFAIFVSLMWRAEQFDNVVTDTIFLGAFTVFPPDQPGRYIVDSSNAQRLLPPNLANQDSAVVTLLITLEAISETDRLSDLEVQLARPEW